MRVMIDASVCSVGGGVQVALNLLSNIAYDKNFEVICVASPQLDSQLSLELKKQFFKYFKEENVSVLKKNIQGKRIALIEDEYKPQLVFVVFGPSYWRPKAKTLQGFALPLLVYPETRNKVYKDDLLKLIYQKILNSYKAKMVKQNADYLVVETNTFKERVHEVLGVPKSNIFVIENSFNSNFLCDKPNLKFVDDKILNQFFIPSAYYPHKNLEVLVSVAQKLVEKNFNNFVFNFLVNPSSDEWGRIIKLTRILKVEKYFKTYGLVKNDKMKSLYDRNTFVLLPTLAEASTAVYPEAFACKKVLLTSDLDFSRELCGDAAVYFNPYDPTHIADTIIKIVNDTERQKKLIELGSKQISLSYVTPYDKWLKQKQLILDLI